MWDYKTLWVNDDSDKQSFNIQLFANIRPPNIVSINITQFTISPEIVLLSALCF